MSKSTIFLLENDDATRPILRKVLVQNGYKVLLAIDEQDALQRVDDGFAQSNLLMVNLLGKSEREMIEFGDSLREKRNPNMPIIVIAAKYDKEMQGTFRRAGENEYIVYLGGGDELFDLLANLTDSSIS